MNRRVFMRTLGGGVAAALGLALTPKRSIRVIGTIQGKNGITVCVGEPYEPTRTELEKLLAHVDNGPRIRMLWETEKRLHRAYLYGPTSSARS